MAATEPASTNLINALSPIRTRRPTCTNSIRRSAIKRRTKSRSGVQGLTRLIHRVKHDPNNRHLLTVGTACGAPRRCAVDSDRSAADGLNSFASS
jgi:hypothetical protein